MIINDEQNENDRIGEHGRRDRISTVSEIVTHERAMATNGMPSNVSNLSITKSSHVHFGPKFVNVTVEDTEGIKGRILGLELVSANSKRRLRCSVAVFVCWALIAISALAAYLFIVILPRRPTRMDLDFEAAWYFRRDNWQALKVVDNNFRPLPVKQVIIGHSVTADCDRLTSCIAILMAMQQEHQRRGFSDIVPNYLVGGRGFIFEGRGANVIGAMIASLNTGSITIMFLGNFSHDNPNDLQFDHLDIFLDVLVKEGVLISDYKLYGHCQRTTFYVSPGPKIMERLHRFSHWDPVNASTCLDKVPIQNYLWKYCKQTTRAERLSCAGVVVALIVCVALIIYFTVKSQATADIIDDPSPHEWNITRDMWIAKPVEYDQNSTTMLYQPVHLVVIQHSVSTECHQFITCAAEVRNIQAYYLAYKKYDIPYNFLVGNDGRVYEGRGWGIGGAHTAGYNLCSVGIGFIGDYREEGNMRSKVTAAQVLRVQLLLDYGVSKGYLAPDYWVAGAKDLQSSESPGTNLYNEIRSWQHYDHKHRFQNRTCSQIYAKLVDKN